MTSFHWALALVIGGVGGALNAVVSDHARLLPSIVTLTPGGTRIVRVGIVGNNDDATHRFGRQSTGFSTSRLTIAQSL